MALNPQQQRIVSTLDNAVNVAAGAGTGKTYTLTQRIVACVKKVISEEDRVADPMQCVLAITFTNKAAEELRSRVRSALLVEAAQSGDMRLRECALNVDNAWISTIHAMASRILKENALEFGIDPSFELLSEDGANAIFENSLNKVLEQARLDDDPSIAGLLSKVSMTSSGFNSYSLVSMIDLIASKAKSMPNGFDGIDIPVTRSSPSSLLRKLIDASSDVLDILRFGDWSESDAKNRLAYLDELEAAIAKANEALEVGLQDDFYDDGLDIGEYLEIIFSFPPTTNKFPFRTKIYAQDFSDYRAAYKDVANEVLASVGSVRLQAIIDLAKRVHADMDRVKNSGRTLLSQGDLLRICNERLSDPRNLDIVERYRKRFSYIMIDEFQDTDRLQMSLIAKLARKGDADGHAGLVNVCTVGDMQQSIYRFRGADVSLAKQRSAELRDIKDAQFELTSNYRSHKAVLDSVEMVFSQREVFGDDFLKLDACSSSLDEDVASKYASLPRINYDFLHCSSKRDVSTDLAKTVAALKIGAHFKELIDSGVAASRLAILLGRARGADIYQRALSFYGIESVVVKGSIFSGTKEALLVRDALDLAANVDQEECLFRLLSSELFNVSDDDLLKLTFVHGDPSCGSTAFAAGFKELANSLDKDESDMPARFSRSMVSAAKALWMFIIRARSGSPSAALRGLLLESGLLLRLESQRTENGNVDAASIASAANLNKAIGIVADIEVTSSGIAAVALDYSSYLDTENVTPGTFSTGNSDFVRIITVHSSKGLEYDHVAVAELKSGISNSSRFVVENCGDKTYVAMKALDSEFLDPQTAKKASKVCGFTFEGDDDACYGESDVDAAFASSDPAKAFLCISEHSKQQDLEEARRLLYVAMTRARETLYISHVCSTDPGKPYKGIYHDIESALDSHFSIDDEAKTQASDMVQMPIRYVREVLSFDGFSTDELAAISFISDSYADSNLSYDEDNVDGEQPISVDREFLIPQYNEAPSRDFKGYSAGREGVHSYTSLSKGIYHDITSALGHTEGHEVTKGANVKDSDVIRLSLSHDVEADGDTIDANRPVSDDDKATDLGTAFHRLAQLAIIEGSSAADSGSSCRISKPDDARVQAQVRSCGLSEVQFVRLRQALDLWFDSDECAMLGSYGSIAAEVPFCVQIDDGNGGFILEGEIDALATRDDGCCLFVDYKTGGSIDEDAHTLHEKHLLQSQCYAYALLCAGFDRVDAHFVRVEQCVEETGEPQIVKYSYGSDDINVLRDAIVCAHGYSIEDYDR